MSIDKGDIIFGRTVYRYVKFLTYCYMPLYCSCLFGHLRGFGSWLPIDAVQGKKVFLANTLCAAVKLLKQGLWDDSFLGKAPLGVSPYYHRVRRSTSLLSLSLSSFVTK